MTDGAQHPRSILTEPEQPGLHVIEGLYGLADIIKAIFGKRRNILAV